MQKTMEPLDAYRGFRDSKEALNGVMAGRYDMAWFFTGHDRELRYVATRSLRKPGRLQVTCFRARGMEPLSNMQCISLWDVPAWLRTFPCEVFCVHYQHVSLA